MTDFRKNLVTLLVREIKGFERELDLFPDESSVFKTAPGASNSAGNLAFHVAGNLQHFIGAILGGSGYVRNRDYEFARKTGTRAEMKAELLLARNAVETVIPALSDETLANPFPLPLVPEGPIETALFLQHLCSHAAFHLGQAGYLRRVALEDTRSAGPVPLKALAH